MFQKIGIVTKPDREEALRLADKIGRHLQSRGMVVVLESELAKLKRGTLRLSPLNQMRTDLIVTIGGDGTILKTCLSIPRPETPILAINMGERGFLTETRPEEALSAIDRCLEGDYVLEKCFKLSSSIEKKTLPDALNEILVASKTPSKMLALKALTDSLPIIECHSDGLIISTPTGSTAYSLSAGGPVLDPCLEAFALTPVCPLTPTRPIVVPSKNTVRIELLKPGSEAHVVVDGQYETKMTAEDSMIVRKSEHHTNFVRFGESFYRRFRSRFLFPAEG